MTQNNEMPDVLYTSAQNEIEPGEYMCGVDGDIEDDEVVYIRKGAPSPWIDPAVMPIPEGLADDRSIFYKRTSASGGWMLELHTVARARDYAILGMLLGYIILPE